MDLLGLGFLALELRDTKPEKLTKDLDEPRKLPRRQVERGKCRDSNCLAIITLDQLAWHDSTDDCWVAIYDYVYDCTEFLNKHPGGAEVLAEYAGRDATLAFIGSGHTQAATRLLDKYLIGELPLNERLFRKLDGIKIITN